MLERGCNRLKGVVGDLQVSNGRQEGSDIHRAAADCRIEYQTSNPCVTIRKIGLLLLAPTRIGMCLRQPMAGQATSENYSAGNVPRSHLSFGPPTVQLNYSS
jgi:hypothetical protein